MSTTYPRIFLTVGTTQFQSLVDAINTPDAARILHTLGCQHLTIQTGTSQLDGDRLRQLYAGIETEFFDYRPTIQPCIAEADLVISHAGAGSCIETLKAGKTMVVVVNENLMDNHQIELAERLHRDGYIFYCVPGELMQTLQAVRTQKLQLYERGDAGRLVREIDKLMNFV